MSFRKSGSDNRGEARFAAVGDVFLGDQPMCLGFGVRSLSQRGTYSDLFTDVQDTLRQYPVVVANLETVIADQSAVESVKTSVSVDRADSGAAGAMRDAGISLVSLANNHIFEYGVQGLEETERNLNACGLGWIGKKNHVVRVIEGNKVAFLSWSMLPDNYWPDVEPADYYNLSESIDPILAEVIKVSPTVDFVVLMLHWGNELVHHPSVQQQDLAQRLIDGGVDVILGHHPHVLQPIERYKKGIIAYSLGNFVMDSWEASTHRSIILEIRLGPHIEYQAIAVSINGRTYRPSIIANEEEKSLTLAVLNCDKRLEQSEYLKAVHGKRKGYRRSSIFHFIKNIHRYGVRNLAWALKWGFRRVVFLIKVARVEKRDPNIVYRGPMD